MANLNKFLQLETELKQKIHTIPIKNSVELTTCNMQGKYTNLTKTCVEEHGQPYKLKTIPTEPITYNPIGQIIHNPTKSITHEPKIEDILSKIKNIK